MQIETTAKLRGRPPKPESEKRQQIGVRTSPEMKARLEAAAAANGRSVAQEAEFLLAEKFAFDDAVGGPRTTSLLIGLAGQIARAEAATGKPWHSDVTTHRAATILLDDHMRSARPLPPHYAKVTELTAKHVAAIRRKDLLTEFLASCEVIKDRRNALVAFADPKAVDYQICPESEWRNPRSTGAELDKDDLDALRQFAIEWATADQEVAKCWAEIGSLMGPHWEARKLGERLADTLLGRSPVGLGALSNINPE